MFPRTSRGNRSAQVFTLRCSKINGVHRRIFQASPKLFHSVNRLSPKFRRQLLSFLFVPANQRNKFCLLRMLKRRQHRSLRNRAQPHHRKPNLLLMLHFSVSSVPSVVKFFPLNSLDPPYPTSDSVSPYDPILATLPHSQAPYESRP